MTKQEKETYELIDRYVNHTLSREEQESFELRMEQDTEFSRDVKAHMKVHRLIMDQGLINIKQKLRKIHESEKGGNDNLWKYFSGVAFIITVCAVIYFNNFYKTDELNANKVKVEKQRDTVSNNKEHTHEKSQPIVEDAVSNNKEHTHEKNQPVVEKNKSTKKDKKTNPISLHDDAKSSQDTTQRNKDIPSVAPFIAESKVMKEQKKDTTSTVTSQNSYTDKIDCSVVTITGETNTIPSCDDKPTGNIIIALGSLKGGKKPYKFSIKNDEFTIASNFSNLPPGFYQVSVKDDNGCVNLLQ